MNNTIRIQTTLPWWIPPERHLGYKLAKNYWMFTSILPNGFIQTIYGLN